MPFFEFQDWIVNHYWSNGYIVLRQILPGSLLKDLRVAADRSRALAYKLNGPHTQRIRPIVNYADDLDLQAFHDYCELPELVDAIHKLMGPDYRHHNIDRMGLLVNPEGHSWNQGWHRDAVVEVPHPVQADDESQATLEGACTIDDCSIRSTAPSTTTPARGTSPAATPDDGICRERCNRSVFRACRSGKTLRQKRNSSAPATCTAPPPPAPSRCT
jgi:hypothetical protein